MYVIKKYRPTGGRKKHFTMSDERTYKVTVEMSSEEFRDFIGETPEGECTSHHVNLSHNEDISDELNHLVETYEINGMSGKTIFGNQPLKVYQKSHKIESGEWEGDELEINPKVLGLKEIVTKKNPSHYLMNSSEKEVV